MSSFVGTALTLVISLFLQALITFAPLPSPLQLRSCPRDDCGFVPKLGFTRLSLPGLYQLLAAKPSNRLLELFDSVGGQWPHKGLDLFYRELCAPQLSRSVQSNRSYTLC